MKFKARKTHGGQYRPYGDSFEEWDIETDLPKEEVLKRCFAELSYNGIVLPNKKEWQKNIRHGGSHERDYGYYFRGYHSLWAIDDGYHFTICKPYTD